jgi:hypothetical protein
MENYLTQLEAATYISVWDDGVAISSNCLYDRKTNVISEIETIDVDGLDMLIDEYILLSDGTQIRNFINEDDIF